MEKQQKHRKNQKKVEMVGDTRGKWLSSPGKEVVNSK